jgi:hypothetical protein
MENPVFMRLPETRKAVFFPFFLLINPGKWGRISLKVVESGLKCNKVVESGSF